MRTQLLGIYISLMVHGMAGILLYGVSHGITPTVRTLALDFSLDSGGRMGMDGSEKRGGPGGDEALPQAEAPMNPENTRLSGVAEPPPLVSEEGPLVLEETAPAAEASIPAVEEPQPISAELPPKPEKTPPVAQKPPPAHRIVQDSNLIAVNKTISPKIVRPKPVSSEK